MKKVFPLVLAVVFIGLLVLSVRTINTFKARRVAQQATSSIGPDLDFFLTKVTQQHFNSKGTLVRQLHADRLEHYTDSNRFKFVEPIFVFFHDLEAPWQVTAKLGFSTHGQQQFYLKDKVKITRDRTKFNSLVTVDTDHLTVYPELKVANTDAVVSFLEDANFMQGKGADVDFNKGFIKLASKVQIWYKINF